MNLINRIGEELGFALNFVKVGLLLTCFLVAIADLFMQEDGIMWKHRTLIDDAVEIFSNLCGYMGVTGKILNSNVGKNFLCVIAPEGGVRAYELNDDWLENIAAGWDKGNIRVEITKDIISKLSFGGLDSTPYSDLSINDRDYFDNFNIKLADLTVSRAYMKLQEGV